MSLLEPLADALDLRVLDLLRGERTEEPEPEPTVREALRLLARQARERTRRRWGQILGGAAALAIVGLVLFAVLDRAGVFLRPVSLTVTAAVYTPEGQPAGETTVTIEGSLYWLGERSFWGTFAVEAAEKTCREGTYGSVSWGREETEGYQEIYWGRAGVTRVETEVQPDCYVSPDLQRFALTLSDGRVVATDETLAALQALTPCRYVLDWQVEYPSMRCYRE